MNFTKLYRDDCLEVMKRMIEMGEKVDCVITDCPYKLVGGGVSIEEKANEPSGCLRRRAVSDGTKCSNKGLKKNEDEIPCAVKKGKMFTNNDINFEDWLPYLYEVLKDNSHCYIMINGRNLCDLQKKAEKVGFKFQNLLVWDKGNATPNQYYMQAVEFILMLRKGGAKRINNMGTKNIIRIPNPVGKKVHPTEKPVELMKILIENSTNENDIVFDPFMGSGTTGVACNELNRNFVGIDIDDKYFKIAEERIGV